MVPVNIAPLTGQATDTIVVDVHRTKTLSRTSGVEYLVSLSARLRNKTGGFGFVTLKGDPKFGAGAWATNGPPMSYGNFIGAGSAVCYGEFRITPTVRTPLVHVATGETVLFTPWVTAPYVTNSAEILDTDGSAYWLTDCVRDYDGDGLDETVLVQSAQTAPNVFVLVGDPSKNRRYTQFFSLMLPAPARQPSIWHGCTGDFDGDGFPDLLLSYQRSTQSGPKGYFALFANTQAGKGRPSLRRQF